MPLHFEANHGQVASDVRFIARGQGYRLFLTDRDVVLGFRGETLRLSFVAASHASVQAVEELGGKVNYLIGANASGWRTDVPTYARVEYRGIYPGVDAVFYGNQRRLEYDFIVHPGADPERIRMRFAGARALTVDGAGDLHIRLGAGSVVQHRPVIYQEVDGVRRSVRGGYVVRGDKVAVKVEDYDRSRPLVIDPVLSYSTYLGGNGDDDARAIAIDAAGNAVVVGSTLSTNFPAVNAHDGTKSSGRDAFVTKLNAAGTAFVFSTYLGGSLGATRADGVAIDASGNIYITGQTHTDTFPTTPGVFQPTHRDAGRGTPDAFVTKLNAAGSALVYSTFLGGTAPNLGDQESGFAIAVDSAGNAYVAGATASADFPTTAGSAKPTLSGSGTTSDAFVAKLNPAGSALLYSSFLGGTGNETARGIAIEESGMVYVVGTTTSTAVGTTPGVLKPDPAGPSDASDAFVIKLSSTGGNIVYATRFGGSGPDDGRGIDIDAGGNVYISGITESADLPTVNAFQPSYGGAIDAFAAKLNTTGTALAYSTYLGGSNQDEAYGVAVDATGAAHVVGGTHSADFPSVNPLPPEPGTDETLSFRGSVFVTKLGPSGGVGSSEYSIRLGHSTTLMRGRGITLDGQGNAYITGQATGTLPTTPGSPQPQLAAGEDFDAFIAKIGPGSSGGGGGGIGDTTPPAVSITSPSGNVWTGNSIGFSVTASDNAGLVSIKLWGNGGVFATINCSGTTCSGNTGWITGPLPPAAYQVHAVALDTAGNQTLSTPVTIFKDATSPLVPSGASASTGGGGTTPPAALGASITSPANGATVSGTSVGVTMTASNAQGTPIAFVLKVDNGATIFSGSGPASTATTTWNTTGLTNGAHTLNLTVTDGVGRTATAATSVTVSNATGGGGGGDTTPPTVSITSPSGNVWTGNSIGFSVTASDNVGLVSIKLWGNGAVFATVNCSGTTCSGNTGWITGPLPPAAYQVHAVAQDTAGNQKLSTPVTLFKDATSPLVASGASASTGGGGTTPPPPLGAAITAPANGATVSGSAVPVTMSASNAQGSPTSFVLKVDNGATIFSQSVSGSTASTTWNTTGLSNGAHTLNLTVTDSAGRTATAAVSVTVSNTTTTPALGAAITSPANGATVSGAAVPVSMSASNAQGSPTSFVLKVDNGATILSQSVAGSTASTSWNTTGLTNGAHTLNLTVTDGAGRTATAAISVTVSNTTGGGAGGDTTPPTVSITSPSGNVWTGNSIGFSVTASDNAGLVSIKLWGNGAVFATVNCSGTTCSGNTGWITGPLPPAAYQVHAVALDTGGNQTLSTPVTIFKDATSPFVASGTSGSTGGTTPPQPLGAAITAPANGATVSGAAVPVSMNASNAQGSPTSFVLKVDNGATIFSQSVSGSTASTSWNTTGLTNGAHTLNLTVTDGAGRTASAAITVTVSNTTGGGGGGGDTTAPTVAITDPPNGAWTGNSIDVTASASDNVGIATLKFFGNGTQFGQATCPGTTTCTATEWWTTGPLPSGQHTLTVVATDTAGNTKTSAPVVINK